MNDFYFITIWYEPNCMFVLYGDFFFRILFLNVNHTTRVKLVKNIMYYLPLSAATILHCIIENSGKVNRIDHMRKQNGKERITKQTKREREKRTKRTGMTERREWKKTLKMLIQFCCIYTFLFTCKIPICKKEIDLNVNIRSSDKIESKVRLKWF